MLQHLVILLDDTATSYCHYTNTKSRRRPIALDDLKAGILFAMKENAAIQFVYPDYELTGEYKKAIGSIDHSNVAPAECEDRKLPETADIIVFNNWDSIRGFNLENRICVLRTGKKDLFRHYTSLPDIIGKMKRLNVVLTDIETFTDSDFDTYAGLLDCLSEEIVRLNLRGMTPQLNLLTDRIMLDAMNNCNAGCENITLAPDGKFYICPAFYLADDGEDFGIGKAKFDIGSPAGGLHIRNSKLYELENAPICRNCDAFQCKRCVWLNRKLTYEVNTPGREQCVVAHIERNASRKLLLDLKKNNAFHRDKSIREINCLDPFEMMNRWQ